MKTMLRIISAVAVAATIGLIASTSAHAGNSYAFSFGYNSGGYGLYGGYGYRGGNCGPRYAFNFGYAYCPPPVYYYAPPPPPPPQPVYYYRPPQPVYYYSGGTFYCR